MAVIDKYLKAQRKDLSELRRKKREVRKNKNASEYDKVKYDVQIEDLQEHIKRFSKSNMEPVVYGNIIINNKVYSPFMKKIEKMYKEVTEEKDKLVIDYGVHAHDLIGRLTLYDLTDIFESYGIVMKEIKLEEIQ